MKFITNNFLIAFLVISVGITSRVYLDLGHNFEMITALSVLSGYFYKGRYSFLPILLVLFVTDTIIGNSSIYLFTWSGFIIGHILGKFISGRKNGLFITTGTSILSVLLFYIWTNFGVVLTTSMYPNTIEGLIQSYINAIPFLRPQLLSAVIFTPIFYLIIYSILNLHAKYSGKQSSEKSYQ